MTCVDIMAAPARNLRGRMALYGMEQKDLARLLNRGSTYISLRMNGHEDWTITEALKMMEHFRIPKEQFLDYFGHDPVKVF